MTMKIRLVGRAATVVGVLAAATAIAQPPDSVGSDAGSNTAMGGGALWSLSSGVQNTAAGAYTLYSNTSGNSNTAAGVSSLGINTTGSANTAFGYAALYFNNASGNVAFGDQALYNNTSATGNSAFGHQALLANTTGQGNTGIGSQALLSNTTGVGNTATGDGALLYESTGGGNTAVGATALVYNKSGQDNTAVGNTALYNNTGSMNTAVGTEALYGNYTGSSNIAIGWEAGWSTTGSHNIVIGHLGAAESGTIRIGTPGTQTAAYMAGISTTKVTGSAVYITSSGHLGVLASSERYKTDIAPMGRRTSKLAQLRPVTFKLKTDPRGAIQYGLIAEEVNKIYPELVIRDDAGKIQGVRYEEISPMLLNEVNQQDERLAMQERQLQEIRKEVKELKEANVALRAALQATVMRAPVVANLVSESP